MPNEPETIKLNQVQTFAIQSAREKVMIAQNIAVEIIRQVAVSMGIKETDLAKWSINAEGTILAKIQSPAAPALKIPKSKT